MGVDSNNGTGNSCLQTYNQNSNGNYNPDYNLLLQPYGGRVGIGTNSPGTDLHVYDSDGHCQLKVESGASGGDAELWLKTNTSSWSIWNNGSDDSLRFYEGSDRVVFDGNGNVGIGTSSPACPLHVHSYSWTSVGDTHRWLTINAQSGGTSWDGGFGGSIANTNYDTSIKANGWINSSGYIIRSDERIKKDIVDVEDDEALVKLRMLHPKKYRFIDEIARGAHQVYGFLANEVQEVLPDAIVEHPEEVPSIYQFANATSSNVITFSGDFNTSQLESNVLVVVGVDQVRHELTVDEIIDSTSVRVVEDLSAFSGSLDEHGNVVTETQTLSITPEEYADLEDKVGFKPISDDSNVITEYTKTTTTYVGDQLFVYGEVVDDFKHLQESAISTLSTAALQEVDRQQQADKVRIADLESRIQALEAQLASS